MFFVSICNFALFNVVYNRTLSGTMGDRPTRASALVAKSIIANALDKEDKEIEENDVYRFERVLDKKIMLNGCVYYLVKWIGYPT